MLGLWVLLMHIIFIYFFQKASQQLWHITYSAHKKYSPPFKTFIIQSIELYQLILFGFFLSKWKQVSTNISIQYTVIIKEKISINLLLIKIVV